MAAFHIKNQNTYRKGEYFYEYQTFFYEIGYFNAAGGGNAFGNISCDKRIRRTEKRL